jgi:hypothetical protein
VIPWDRPRPVSSGETKRFWDACREGRFLIQRCDDCGYSQYYYRGACCRCWSSNVTDVKIAGDGVVHTYTVIERNRTVGFKDQVPYVVALIEIPEGVKVLSNIVNIDPDDVRIGMSVQLAFEHHDDFSIPVFEPVVR